MTSNTQFHLRIQEYFDDWAQRCTFSPDAELHSKSFNASDALLHCGKIQVEANDAGAYVQIIHTINHVADFTQTPRKRSHWLWKLSTVMYLLSRWCADANDEEEVKEMLTTLVTPIYTVVTSYLKEYAQPSRLADVLWYDFVQSCAFATTECKPLIEERMKEWLLSKPTGQSESPWKTITHVVKEKCVILGSDYDTLVTKWEKECQQKSYWTFLTLNDNIPIKLSTHTANTILEQAIKKKVLPLVTPVSPASRASRAACASTLASLSKKHPKQQQPSSPTLDPGSKHRWEMVTTSGWKEVSAEQTNFFPQAQVAPSIVKSPHVDDLSRCRDELSVEFASFQSRVSTIVAQEVKKGTERVVEELNEYKRKYEELLAYAQELESNINTIFAFTNKRTKRSPSP